MSRKLGLYGGNLPSFAELFATRTSSINSGRNNSSAGTISLQFARSSAPIPQVGSTWYSFYAIGGCLEISRIDYTSSTTLTKTRLSYSYSSDGPGAFYGTSVSGTQLVGNDSVYGGLLTVMKFDDTYDLSVIDTMFRRLRDNSLDSYYSSTPSGTSLNGAIGVPKEIVTRYGGVVLAMFYGTKYNFSVSRAVTPTTLITGASGGTINRTVIFEADNNNVPTLYPTENGSSLVSLRSYSLFRFR